MILGRLLYSTARFLKKKNRLQKSIFIKNIISMLTGVPVFQLSIGIAKLCVSGAGCNYSPENIYAMKIPVAVGGHHNSRYRYNSNKTWFKFRCDHFRSGLDKDTISCLFAG
jgi:hypothetical protein